MTDDIKIHLRDMMESEEYRSEHAHETVNWKYNKDNIHLSRSHHL
jgi:hypothetical protein